MTTQPNKTKIDFLEALGSKFENLESQTDHAGTMRSRVAQRILSRRFRGPALALGLILLTGTGVASATGTLPSLNKPEEKLTPITSQATPFGSHDISAYRKDGLFCLRVTESDQSRGFSDACANLQRPPYSDPDHALGVMLQQSRPDGGLIFGVASTSSTTVEAIGPHGTRIGGSPVAPLADGLRGGRALGTFAFRVPPGKTADHVVGLDSHGRINAR